MDESAISLPIISTLLYNTGIGNSQPYPCPFMGLHGLFLVVEDDS
jgi:hypothetical protein